MDKLEGQHPGADTELHHRNAFELLIATMLSAQSTDARVNLVTPALFKRYPDAAALAGATPEDLSPRSAPRGSSARQTKSIVGAARTLVGQHGGHVPADMDALIALPGRGPQDTANVVLGHTLGVPGLAGRSGMRCAWPTDRSPSRTIRRRSRSNGSKALPKVNAGRGRRTRWILHGRRIRWPNPRSDQCDVRGRLQLLPDRLPRSASPGWLKTRP